MKKSSNKQKKSTTKHPKTERDFLEGVFGVKKDVYVVAEIGKNFIQTAESHSVEEYLANAKKLINAAVKAGVDAVKFQTHELEDEQLNINVVSPHFAGADRYNWVRRNTEATPISFWNEIRAHAASRNIVFFSTPMSRGAAQKLEGLDVPLWKVGSGDVTDLVMLDFLAGTGKPIVFSTGMVSFDELDRTVDFLRKRSAPIVILYCVSEYPCPPEAFNLGTIDHLKERYPDAVIGFSDHSVGNHAPVLGAAKLGARIIEKHFSFDRSLWGSDHKVSVLPDEMAELVRLLSDKRYETHDISNMYGDKDRELAGAENSFRPYFHKALVAARDIPKGTTVTLDMVYAMRPLMHAKGLPANQVGKVVGRHLKKELKKYDPITLEVVE